MLATGQLLPAVAAQPIADTLLTFLHLLERERVDRLHAEADALRFAELVAMASWAPQGLADARRAFLDRAGLLPSADEAQSAGAALLAQALSAGFLPTPAAPPAP